MKVKYGWKQQEYFGVYSEIQPVKDDQTNIQQVDEAEVTNNLL